MSLGNGRVHSGIEFSPGESDVRSSSLELLKVIWRRKAIVLGSLILCVAVAVALDLHKPKQYGATATVEFRTPGFDSALLNGNTLFPSDTDPIRTTQTNADVISSPDVAALVRRQLHTGRSLNSLLGAIVVSPSGNADLATITATGSTPQQAANIANAFASGYIAYRQTSDRQTIARAVASLRASLASATPQNRASIETSLSELETLRNLQTGNADITAPASPQRTPVSPNIPRDVIFAVVVGLLLGIAIALIVERLDQRLRSTEEIERAYERYPLVATVPHVPDQGSRPHVEGPAGEAYRMMRVGLRFLRPSHPSRCFLVTSAITGEGKSSVAVNLAISAAAMGERVILIDADLRRPTAAASAGAMPAGRAGLSDLLISRDGLDEYLIAGLEQPTLSVLPSGTSAPSPSDLMRIERLSEVIAEARERADTVIIDTPPLLPVADTHVLLQVPEIDLVVLVARVGLTRRDHAARTNALLSHSGHQAVGLVVTDVPGPPVEEYYYAETRHPRAAPTREPARDRD